MTTYLFDAILFATNTSFHGLVRMGESSLNIRSAATAYAATTMAEAMMAVLYEVRAAPMVLSVPSLKPPYPQFYYVDLFLNVYGVDEYWFYASEMLYMIWNAINDPLCVWLQDHSDLGGTAILVFVMTADF